MSRSDLFFSMVSLISPAILVLAGQPASAQVPDQDPPPVVAVLDITFDNVQMADDAQGRMNDYLVSCMSGNGAFMVVPRDDVARALSEQRVKFSSDCYGSCRKKIGGYLAAARVLQTKMWRMGKVCMLTSDMYDLQSDTNIGSHTVKDLACTEAGLMKGIETVAEFFGGGVVVKSSQTTTPGSGRSGSGGGFQVSDLPAVPSVTQVSDLPVEDGISGIGDVDVDGLEAYDAVVAIDRDQNKTVQDKIRAWEDLGRRFPSYASKATQRVADWRRYEAEVAEAKRVENLRREAMEKDWGKLSRLLKLKVISDEQKREWAAAFISAYGSDSTRNPHYRDLLQYTVPKGFVLIPAGTFLMGSP
ncbi:MAG TPA: hypothetical protein PLZ31_12220, partial [Myxococcota bacterium]|nr:hypothetical protein [Myxococcota bacterium]